MLPVGTFADPAAPPVLRGLDDIGDEALAELVRLQVGIDRHQGWVLLLGLLSAIGALGVVVVLLGAWIDSRLIFGASAALAAFGAVGLSVAAERAGLAVVRHRARDLGLIDVEVGHVVAVAHQVDHWLDGLARSGKTASDTELAAFVRRR